MHSKGRGRDGHETTRLRWRIQRDHIVQTLATNRADHSIAKGIRHPTANRRLQHQTHSLLRRPRPRRRCHDRVSQITMAGFAVEEGRELLPCPLRPWMFGDVHVQDPTRSDLHRDEHIEHLECCRHQVKKSHATIAWGPLLPPAPRVVVVRHRLVTRPGGWAARA
jgi:hypothetical protein